MHNLAQRATDHVHCRHVHKYTPTTTTTTSCIYRRHAFHFLGTTRRQVLYFSLYTIFIAPLLLLHTSGESTWDHPCDEYYRKLYEEEKKKKTTSDKAKHDKSKQQVNVALYYWPSPTSEQQSFSHPKGCLKAFTRAVQG